MRTLLLCVGDEGRPDALLASTAYLLQPAPVRLALLRVHHGQDLGSREGSDGQLRSVAPLFRDAAVRFLLMIRSCEHDLQRAQAVLEAMQDLDPCLVVLQCAPMSLAKEVLRSRRAPVLVLPAETRLPWRAAPSRILVPLDGSKRSAYVLTTVGEIAERHGSELIIVEVQPEGSAGSASSAAEIVRLAEDRACDLIAMTAQEGVCELVLEGAPCALLVCPPARLD